DTAETLSISASWTTNGRASGSDSKACWKGNEFFPLREQMEPSTAVGSGSGQVLFEANPGRIVLHGGASLCWVSWASGTRVERADLASRSHQNVGAGLWPATRIHTPP